MSAAARPWWASEGEPDPEEDPIEAHRAARRERESIGGSRARHEREPTGGPRAPHQPEICGVCPICVAARALGEARPELLEHLAEAARHLAAAMRTVVDTAGDHTPAHHEDADTADPPRSDGATTGDVEGRDDVKGRDAGDVESQDDVEGRDAGDGGRDMGVGGRGGDGSDGRNAGDGPTLRARRREGGPEPGGSRRIRRIELD